MQVQVLNSANEMVKAAADDLNSRAFRQHAALFIITCRKTKRVLVVKRFKDNQIGLPCGKIDAGERPVDAAYRELYEETGVTSDRLAGATSYMASIQFEGTLVHIFQNFVNSEAGIGAAPGFEKETVPQWISVDDLVKTESRFQSFNIVALHKAGLF